MTGLMVQCRLVREHNGHKIILVTWVPQNLAVIGKKLKLEETGEIFSVIKTYTKMDKKSVLENSQDFKHTRKFLDI
jgi:hypothetical protein